MAVHPAVRLAARVAALAVVLTAVHADAGARTDSTAEVTQTAVSRTKLEQNAEFAPAPARFFTIRDVLAKLGGRNSAKSHTQLAALDRTTISVDAATRTVSLSQSPEPFGLFAFRAPEGALWVKQRKLAADLELDAKQIAACRADLGNCYDVTVLRYIAIVEHARKLDGQARLSAVNDTFNAAITYTSDMVQHGVPDLWSSPLASLRSGLGDCEDYAIAKYVALRDAGTPEKDLRLLLVRDRTAGQDHAVLTVYLEGHWLVLDNRWSDLRDDNQLTRFVPLFAIDQRGVSLFAASYSALLPAAEDISPAAPERRTAPPEAKE